MDTAYTAILPGPRGAPFGALGVRLEQGRLAGLDFLPPAPGPGMLQTPLVKKLAAQLEAYYTNPAHVWDLPLAPGGTAFRQKVWQALQTIPAGQTRSYGAVARELGSAARAVGQAVGDNPLPILIPCHRVIAADGGLGGFMHSKVGFSQDIKRWLLGHEGALP